MPPNAPSGADWKKAGAFSSRSPGAFDGLWDNRELKCLRAGFSRKKTVAGSMPGVIKSPICGDGHA